MPYIIWGFTYFVIRIGVESWLPLMMVVVCFLSIGILLTSFLPIREHKLPPLRLILNVALAGILLLTVGSGLVTVAEHQNVPPGIAAVVIVTVPLFTLCFSHLFGIKMRKLEWLGIAVGLAGITMLNSGGNSSGNSWGVILIPIGSVSWAFGLVYGLRTILPVGMMAGAIEMLAAGIVLIRASLFSGEKLTTTPTSSSFMVVAYLALFGSIIAINAYMSLIRNVSPALATSYAYVNSAVAVLLGTGLGGERLAPIEWLAPSVIVLAVVLVTLGRYLFPVKADAVAIPSGKTLQQTSTESIDPRGVTTAADPLDDTFR